MDDTIDVLNQAIGLIPRSAELYAELAKIYIEMEEWDLAIETLREGFENTQDETLSQKIDE